jgi:DNA repair exonuclease SbcCD ATPase subunit
MGKKKFNFRSFVSNARKTVMQKILGKKLTRQIDEKINKINRNISKKMSDIGACAKFRRERDNVQRKVNDLNNQKNQINNFIANCSNTNIRLINKNNALLDTTQYYNNQLFGTNSIKGYVNTALDIENDKTKIVNENIKNVNEPPSTKETLRNRYGGACGRYRKQRDDFQGQINTLNAEIRSLSQKKQNCINANTKIVKKNNVLTDTFNYYNEQIFGYNDPSGKNSIKGYLKTIIDSQNKKDDIVNQKLGQLTENFDSMYNKVYLENNIIQNQINMNKEKHSVDNQKYKDLVNQIDRLKQIDIITSIILLAIIIASGTIIWFSNKSLTHKFVMVKVVWLYVILIEIVEYVLFYAYIYVRAFIFGEQSTYNDYWNFPHLSWLDIVILGLIALSIFI